MLKLNFFSELGDFSYESFFFGGEAPQSTKSKQKLEG